MRRQRRNLDCQGLSRRPSAYAGLGRLVKEVFALIARQCNTYNACDTGAMRTCRIVLLLCFGIASLSYGQTRNARERRSAVPRPDPNAASTKTLAGTFRGTLKDLTSKEIVIQNEEDQAVSIRRNRKTKFLRDEREIKASEIAPDTPVTIEAAQDIDLKPMAITVTADSTPKKTSGK